MFYDNNPMEMLVWQYGQMLGHNWNKEIWHGCPFIFRYICKNTLNTRVFSSVGKGLCPTSIENRPFLNFF